MPKVIAQMVARNEVSRFLWDVLIHLKGIADEIVFTDDHSDDDTPVMARDLGCHVFSTPWEESHFRINEGELRDFAWQNLTQFAKPGDWILAIDADEKLYDIERMNDYLDQSFYDVLGVEFYHMWSPTQYRCDKAWKPHSSSRLFRYYAGGSFVRRKLACGSEPTYVQELLRQNKALWNTPFKMMHLGYVRDEDKLAKYERYMTLDGGDFHARAHIESIVDSHPTLVDWTF